MGACEIFGYAGRIVLTKPLGVCTHEIFVLLWVQPKFILSLGRTPDSYGMWNVYLIFLTEIIRSPIPLH